MVSVMNIWHQVSSDCLKAAFVARDVDGLMGLFFHLYYNRAFQLSLAPDTDIRYEWLNHGCSIFKASAALLLTVSDIKVT